MALMSCLNMQASRPTTGMLELIDIRKCPYQILKVACLFV